MNHGMAPGLFGMLWSSGHVRAGVCSCYGLDGSQTYKRLEQDYIQFRGSVLSLAVRPLVPFPLAEPPRFSSSARKPELESRLLYTGHRMASK